MDIPVILIVKAPNQQFEDQTIKCELSWTIKRLKGYLSEVYPCKPSTDEQKLIYSGQLLHDAIVLKDVLRTYEEEVDAPQIHTVHLVYTPKYKPNNTTTADRKSDKTMPAISTTDGIRQRNVPSTSPASSAAENQAGTASQYSSDIPSMSTSRLSGGCSTSGSSNSNVNNNLNGIQNFMNIPNNVIDAQQQFNPNNAAQQFAMHNWMQQAYMQYLNQYMNLMQMGTSSEAMLSGQTTFPAVSPSAFYPQNIDPLSVINQPQSLSIPTPQVQSPPAPAVQQPQDGQPAAPVGDGAAAAVAPQPQNQPPPQPRFPNIVIDDNQDNRDWLDRFYTISRLILFITLIYFYSSPVRCLIVLLVGIGLYFYNAGMFRMNGEINNNNQRQQPNVQRPVEQQQPRDAGNNNNPVAGDNNNNVVEPQPNDGPADEIDGPAAANQNNAATLENSAESQNRSTDDVETRSILSFIRTFVVSFFTSLIPEPTAL